MILAPSGTLSKKPPLQTKLSGGSMSLTAVGDFLKDQATILAAKLAECNVPFIYRFYGDAEHELGHVFHCNIKTRDAALCNDEECNFFREFC